MPPGCGAGMYPKQLPAPHRSQLVHTCRKNRRNKPPRRFPPPAAGPPPRDREAELPQLVYLERKKARYLKGIQMIKSPRFLMSNNNCHGSTKNLTGFLRDQDVSFLELHVRHADRPRVRNSCNSRQFDKICRP